MEQLKQNIVFVILGVVLVGVLGWYFVTVPPLQDSAEANKGEVQSLAKSIGDLARTASKDDTLKNEAHVGLAIQYGKALDTQISDLQKSLKEMALQVKYESAPTGDNPFDAWLGERRTKLLEDAKKAGLSIPTEKENKSAREMLMLDPTNQASPDEKLHRAYRLRQLALLEEVVATLVKKYGKQQVSKFEGDPLKPEQLESVEAGAQALESMTVLSAKEQSERTKNAYDEALRRVSKSVDRDRARITLQELPYTVSALEVQFIAPLQSVPAILQNLENNPKYRATLSRVDYQRVSQPFPVPTEGKVTVAGPVPMVNTHYQEAPVRVLATLELFEYDKTKEKKASDEPAKAPAKAKSGSAK